MNMKSQIGIVMGIIILVADLYWTYTSYTDTLWLTLGIIIFVATVIWLALDIDLMRSAMPKKSMPMDSQPKAPQP